MLDVPAKVPEQTVAPKDPSNLTPTPRSTAWQHAPQPPGPVTTYIIISGPILATTLQELLKTIQCPLPVVVDDL